MSPSIGVSVEEGIARLRLCRPPLNILTAAMMSELKQVLEDLAARRDLKAVVLSGEGPHFSAGADVSEHLPPHHERLIEGFRALLVDLDRFPLPVIAAVRGRCLGGGFELVQAADVVIAGENAQFGQPEIGLGVIAPFASAYLPRLAGRGAAIALLLSGDPISAAEAQRVGLVSRVVPDTEVESEALSLAGRMARHSAAALRLAKRAERVGEVGDVSEAGGMKEVLAAEAAIYLGPVMATRDAMEGLRSFIEKRPPRWENG